MIPLNGGETMRFMRFGPKRPSCECDKKRYELTEEDKKKIYNSRLKHWIDWKSADIKPPEGEEIWVLGWHNKGHFPSSFKIAGGEVETGSDGTWRVNTCDNDGAGSHCFYPNDYDDGFKYWCFKWEISVPEEMINWGWSCGIR